MSRSYCQYHHKEPSVWQCESCNTHLCRSCFPMPPYEVRPYRCTLCQGRLDYLGSANSAEPFWERMPFFFLYPLRLTPLCFLIFSTVLMVMAVNMLAGSIFVPFVLLVLVGITYTRFLFKTIELLSEGTESPPTFTDITSGGIGITFKMVAIFAIMLFAIVRLAVFGPNVVIFSVFVFTLVLPACFMLLAMTDSFGQAINPLSILSLIAALGKTYFIMIALANVIFGGPAFVIAQIASVNEGESSSMTLFAVALFLEFYVAAVVFAIMGYTLFQHQGALGYVATTNDDQIEELDPRKLLLAEFSILLREGRYDDALAAIQNAVNNHPNDEEILDRYQQFLLAIKDRAALTKHTVRYLNVLATQGNLRKAADVYLKARAFLKDFVLPSANYRHRIGEELFQRGMHKEAYLLLKSLVEEFPQYEEMDKAYLLAARISSEGLHDDGRAMKFVELILKRFPHSKITNDAEQYRQTLSNLMGGNA